MATSTNVYLFALGVSDTLKLLNDLLYFIMLVISLNDPPAAETMMVNVYPYAHYFFTVAVCVTAWLTVAVAMDRFVAVCHPSRSKALCTIARARSVSVTIFVGMLLLSVPSAFRYRMQAVHDRQQNVTCMEIVTTALGRNKQVCVCVCVCTLSLFSFFQSTDPYSLPPFHAHAASFPIKSFAEIAQFSY